VGEDPGRLPSLEALVSETLRGERIKSVVQESSRVRQLHATSEATAAVRAKIAAAAFARRESKDWHFAVERSFEGLTGTETYDRGDFKCNLFVYEMLKEAGVRIELEVRESFFGVLKSHPPLAGQWADPTFRIPGFEVLKVPPDSPQPGDVAAVKKDSLDATGHVGIVVGPPHSPANMTVSARGDGMAHNAWGFRDENKGQVVFRRYVGGGPELEGSSENTGIRTSGVAYDTVPPAPEKAREPNTCGARARGGVK
jgi:hypothetical protein